MNVLWITTVWPEPADSGGKIVTANLVRHLDALGHRITLCALEGPTPRSASGLGPRVRPYGVPSPGSFRRRVRLGVNLCHGLPHPIAKYWSERAWQAIRRLLESTRFDVLHLDHLHTAEYGQRARDAFGLPVVMTAHNVESMLWARLGQRQRNPLTRGYVHIQQRRLQAYEARALTSVDRVHALSPVDAQRLQALAPEASIFAQPPGVLPSKAGPQNESEEPEAVVFLGSLDWPPNAEGATWLATRVWPQVLAKISEARLYLVGRASRRQRRRLAQPTVEVMGWVEDVAPFLERAQVVVVPIQAGSGVRIKLLQALAMGKPVVATTIGAEGLAVEAGRHLELADDPDAFANGVIGLLRDPERRRHLGANGQQLVRSRYRWESTAERIDAAYRQLTPQLRSSAVGEGQTRP